MAKVYPDSNLPVPAIPWGRDVQIEQVEHDRRLNTLEQNVDLNNKGNTSSMGRISQQVNDIFTTINELAKRTTYSVTDSVFNLSWGSPTGQVPTAATISFTLSESRKVNVRATMQASQSISNGAGQTANMTSGMNVIGPVNFSGTSGLNSNITGSMGTGLTLYAERTVVLAAGNYSYNITAYGTNSGSGGVFGNMYGPTLTVTILEPA